MVQRAIGGGILGLLLLGVSPALACSSLATCCAPYPGHLRAARDLLARGDKTAALAELRRANEALNACRREEASGQSLLAAHDCSHHDG